ncbi:MAG: YIP1 family protein [Gemmatimonadetes bacterium]|nr:YIP1 family protein [Gemmatimonadota bacterium]
MESEATQSPQIGLIGRMIRVFHAPRETFESVAASRTAIDWVAPAAVSAVVAFAAAVAVMPLAMEEGAKAIQEQMQGQELSDEQREMMEKMAGPGQAIGLVMAPVGSFVVLVISALLLLGAAKIAGADIGYSGMLTVSAYSSLVQALKGIVVTPLMLSKKSLEVHTGLGLLLPAEMMNSFAGRFLAGIEIFSLWQVVIVAVGVSALGNVDTRKALVPVLVLWLIWLLIAAGLGGLHQMATA